VAFCLKRDVLFVENKRRDWRRRSIILPWKGIMRVRLLKCLAVALVRHGARFLLNLAPGGNVIYDIAADTWEEYRCGGQEADAARAELQELAQAPAHQVQQVIARTVGEVAAKQPAAVQEALGAYLAQVPATIRRSLRRPSDPSASTMPPKQTVREAEDLVQFLPARMPRFKPGDRPLPGVDWELEELAGIGGFGEVWKARHPFLESKPPVALKFCLDPSAIAALRNEAGVLDRVMQAGRHSGIVPLLHTYLSADPPCLEYEFVEGGDLTGLIQEMHARGRVKPEVATRLLLRLAEIVAFAHKAEPPIVHGDLKPANVLVRRMPDGKIALRVIDFGIGGIAAARAAQEVRKPTRSRPQLLTEAVRGAHTPLYASPEQMARRPGALADPRDDVHALGVIWFQLLTGDLAITSIPPDWREQLTERGVGEYLIRLVGACFAPKADKRPASAVVLIDQINAANVPVVEFADADVAGPARAEGPRAVGPNTARPRETRGAAVVQRATARPKPEGATARPAAAEQSKKWLLVGGAGGAVLLAGVIGLFSSGLFRGAVTSPMATREYAHGQQATMPDTQPEPYRPTVFIDEDFRTAFQNKLLVPEGWTPQAEDWDTGQLRVVKGNDEPHLEGVTEKKYAKVKLPPVKLSGNFSIEGTYVMDNDGAMLDFQLFNSVTKQYGCLFQYNGKVKLSDWSDGSGYVSPPPSYKPGSSTRFLLTRKGTQLKVRLNDEEAAVMDFPKDSFDIPEIYITYFKKPPQNSPRLYRLTVGTLPP
jgi:hypothetical protein